MSARPDAPKHAVFIAYPPGESAGNEARYELECEVCELIGAADSLEEALAIAELHEQFEAVLLNAWEVPS